MALELLKDFKCASCTAEQKLMRGCETDATDPEIIDGEEQTRCPRRPIYEDPRFYGEFFQGYWAYREHGTLSEAGGLHDQADWLMQAYRYSDGVVGGIEEQRAAEREERARFHK